MVVNTWKVLNHKNKSVAPRIANKKIVGIVIRAPSLDKKISKQ